MPCSKQAGERIRSIGHPEASTAPSSRIRSAIYPAKRCEKDKTLVFVETQTLGSLRQIKEAPTRLGAGANSRESPLENAFPVQRFDLARFDPKPFAKDRGIVLPEHRRGQ
jgi:hypothetical protein